jgi:hypothetical protein
VDDLDERLTALGRQLADSPPPPRSSLERRVRGIRRRRTTQRIAVASMTAALVVAVAALLLARSGRSESSTDTVVTPPTDTSAIRISVTEQPTDPQVVLTAPAGEAPGQLFIDPRFAVGPQAFAVDEVADLIIVLDNGSGRLATFRLSDGSFLSNIDLAAKGLTDLVLDQRTHLAYVYDQGPERLSRSTSPSSPLVSSIARS